MHGSLAEDQAGEGNQTAFEIVNTFPISIPSYLYTMFNQQDRYTEFILRINSKNSKKMNSFQLESFFAFILPAH